MDDTGAVTLHKKGEQPKLGDAHAGWGGGPRFMPMALPDNGMLTFNLENLTLADFHSMRYHPQINASLSVLTFMIHQADWRIECADKRIADMVEENLRIIWTRMVRAMSQAFWAGYSPSVLEYENDAQGKYVVINKVKDLSPFSAEIKWKKNKRQVQGRERNFYTYDGITQYGYGDIPAINTFWYPVLMENGDHTGRKLLKSAFAPWYFSQLMHVYTNRYFERFGEPLPIGRAPFEDEIIDPDGNRMTGKQVMETVIQGIRNRGAVVLPSDRNEDVSVGASAYTYDIDYLESQMRGVDFERYLSRLDEEMSLALFTPLLLLRNADVGSHSLGVQHTMTWLWMLNALLGDMKEYIDRFIVERLKSINFSPKAERCEWVPRKLGKENVETLRSVITELIRQGIAKPDLDELGVSLGMTIKQVQQVKQDPAIDPTVDPSAPAGDNRDRSERNRAGSGSPRGVGNESVPGTRKIAARIADQIKSTYESDLRIDPINAFERNILGEALADKVTGVIRAIDGIPGEELGDVRDVYGLFSDSLGHVGEAA